MADKLHDKRIAFLVAPEGVEQVEPTEPWDAVSNESATPELVSTEPGEVQAFNHLDKGDTFKVDHTVQDVTPADYDASCMRSKSGLATPHAARARRGPARARVLGARSLWV